MRRVHIEASHAYDVLIGPGLMKSVGELVATVHAPCRAAILTDDTVAGLYGEKVTDSLRAAGFAPVLWAFPHGEQHKNMETLTEALHFLGENQISRGDLVVALGGGVPGDLAGFAAAVYCRGIPFIQVPTTLLAAVDSSVGGKTAVDLPSGKNMAGAFHQPDLVVCDTDVLEHLPPELLRDGAAEIIKYGVLTDEALFADMASGAWKQKMAETVAACVAVKRDYVAQDERDTGARQFLNLGHTFGHAVEKVSGFALTHGQCVAIGMVMAAKASGMDAAAIESACRACGLPTESPYPAAQLSEAALNDKKRKGGKITLVLPERIGKCALKTVDVAALPAYFAKGTGEAT